MCLSVISESTHTVKLMKKFFVSSKWQQTKVLPRD